MTFTLGAQAEKNIHKLFEYDKSAGLNGSGKYFESQKSNESKSNDITYISSSQNEQDKVK